LSKCFAGIYIPFSGHPQFENITLWLLLQYFPYIVKIYFNCSQSSAINLGVDTMLQQATNQRIRLLLFQKSWGKQELGYMWILWINPGKSPGKQAFCNTVIPRNSFFGQNMDDFYAFPQVNTAPGKDSVHPEMVTILKCKIKVHPSHTYIRKNVLCSSIALHQFLSVCICS